MICLYKPGFFAFAYTGHDIYSVDAMTAPFLLKIEYAPSISCRQAAKLLARRLPWVQSLVILQQIQRRRFAYIVTLSKSVASPVPIGFVAARKGPAITSTQIVFMPGYSRNS